jgi:hypothetical protein
MTDFITITARCRLCDRPLTWPLADYANIDGQPVHRSCQTALEADTTQQIHAYNVRARRAAVEGWAP